LKDDETIYKLIGPVLLKQDQTEAESTVNGRLEFIGNEMYVYIHSILFDRRADSLSSSSSRLETHIQDTQVKIEKKKSEIIQVQTSAAQAAQAGQQAVKA